jgi:hypothetical protein
MALLQHRADGASLSLVPGEQQSFVRQGEDFLPHAVP